MRSDIQQLQNMKQPQHPSSNSLMEFAPFGYMWVTVNSKKLIVSHTIYSMLDMEPFSEYLTVQKWRNHVHSADLHKLLQAEEELLYTGSPVLTEYRIITEKGRYLYVTHQMHLSVLPHAEARIMSIICDITEQKSAEIILEGMNECFFELDANFGVRRINEKARTFWNLANKDLQDKSLADIFPVMEETPFLRLLTRARDEKISLVEETIEPVSGHWIHLSTSPYAEGLIVIFFDLENEKEAENKLLESKNLYYSLAENTPDLITRWNRKLELIYANSAFEEKTGISKESLYGKTSTAMGQPHQIATAYMDSLQKVFQTGQPVEHFNSFSTPDGQAYFYSRIVPEKNAKGEVETALGIARDITEINRAEFRLKEQRDLLQGIIDAPSASISVFKVIRNASGKISDFQFEFVNLRMLEFLGGNDPKGKMITEIGGDHVQQLKSFTEVIETGERNSYAQKEESVNGESWVLFSNSPLGNDQLVQVCEDITELKRNENRVMELNKSLFGMNRELNSLNSELKTFTSIAAGHYSETLRHLYINLEMIVTNDARNLSNSGRANLRRAQGAIQKMKLVTEDLISFSKLHEVDTKADRVDLDKILHSAINDFITRPNHPPIEINCDHLPAIVGYPLLLPVLFHHLLDNAIKFRKADEEHVINVTCADRVSGDDVNIDGVVKNFNYTVISVGDNGIGFPGEESEKIFNMFYQLHEKGKYKGSGNGLAICKKIMEMHGGFISAEGTPGEGSSFHCYFPG